MKSILVVLARFIGKLFRYKFNEDKGAILVVSFGTSYERTRKLTIEATEEFLKKEYPDMDFYRAFTSQMIINILKKRDGIEVFNVEEALKFLRKEKYTKVYIQPLHIMNGYEYEKLERNVRAHDKSFENIELGKPLLTHQNDYELVVENYERMLSNSNEALVFIGHGTHHEGGAAYSMLEHIFHKRGYKNVFVGTVEGYPSYDEVLSSLKDKSFEKITLAPFMLVAGDHYVNDIAGDDEESWKTKLCNEGFVVDVIGKGLGEYQGVRNIFLKHLRDIVSNKSSN